jgi:hypothetical protein
MHFLQAVDCLLYQFVADLTMKFLNKILVDTLFLVLEIYNLVTVSENFAQRVSSNRCA